MSEAKPVLLELDNLADKLRQVRALQEMDAVEAYYFCFGKKSVVWRNWEKGDGQYPPLRSVIVIAKKFDINMNWLLLGQGDIFEDVPCCVQDCSGV